MGQIQVHTCPIKGLDVVEPTVHGDSRGYFMETYNQRDMEEAGLNMHFVQDNQSMSSKGVLRGLHFQKQYPQGKLVRVLRGEVFDVAVDLREGSETFGKWYGLVLSAENHKQFYKVTDFWHPGDEGGLAWNDPDIGIEWPQMKGAFTGSADPSGYTMEDGTPLNLSEKDCRWSGIRETWHFQ